MRRTLFLITILIGTVSGLALTRYPHEAFVQTTPRAVVSIPKDGLSTAEFARLIEKLSEPGGYFDTDNLISNEASYLHVLGKLRKMNLTGGAYIGVGPDQNFSYMAQIRPQIAYIIDIRRDNLLQHLFLKSLFALSQNRVEYIGLLIGKPLPENTKGWETKTIQQIVEYFDGVRSRPDRYEAARATVRERVKSFGVPLTEADLTTIGQIHQAFFNDGLDLRFTSRNRPPRDYYPTYKGLLLEKDLTGKQANYLASEADFQFLKDLEAKNLVIPVVGNLAGEKALQAIGRDAAERGLRITAFYTSNIEFYLMREGGFDRFAESLRQLPYHDRTVIIRSYFGGAFGYSLPQTVPGYYSTQLLQTIESLVREQTGGGYDSYSDLVTKHAIDLR
jgi:hypothetical protein